jgi:hypothetical protein
MYYNKIVGVEINPELTLENLGRIYIDGGTFESPKSIAKFEKVGIQYNCQKWVEAGATRINVYYNPDINKIQLTSENIDAPNVDYGYHLGGIILDPSEPSCISGILLPDNGDIEYKSVFDYAYDSSYWHLYHAQRPENIFDDGYDEGFDQTIDPEDSEDPENPTVWDNLL